MSASHAGLAVSPRPLARLASLPLVALFTATLFLGAFQLFIVEPMVGKIVLPALGGAPAVWNTCIVFFQALLLAGYAYAHGATAWLGVRRQAALHAGLVLIPLAVLPFASSAGAPAGEASPVWWLLGLLLGLVGLPFFVLSTSATVLQAWFSVTGHRRAHDPYFLYAASNLGSLAALLAYPLLVEPRLPLREQASLWAHGHLLYAVLTIACVAVVLRQPALAARPGEPRARAGEQAANTGLSWPLVLRWIALSAVPSSLLLGVTTYLSTDVAAVPLLWIVPLCLYLLTFVVAFSRLGPAATRHASRLLPFAALLLTLTMAGSFATRVPLLVPLHVLTFAAAALVCHGELARTRPHVRHLTAYYLLVALGGMLGGLFNSLVAPAVFTSIVEYPLAIVLACALCPPRAAQAITRSSLARDAAAAVVPGAMALAVVLWANAADPDARLIAAGLAVPVLLAFGFSERPLRLAGSIALILVAGSQLESRYGTSVHAERTFYGLYRIQEDREAALRVMTHGTTLHGVQSSDPARREEPLAYYHRTGPFGQAFDALPAGSRSRIAVVGLGAGTLASYARADQQWTFFEIDPAVERIARDPAFFSYLADCGGRCRVVLGDARIALERVSGAAYDLIVLDAFSSDAIPMHLITSEAFALYRSRLRPGGALAVHCSNRYLALGPVLGRLARANGLQALIRRDPLSPASPPGKMASEWVVMAERTEDLGSLASDQGWTSVPVTPRTPLWTDDFSNILSVLQPY